MIWVLSGCDNDAQRNLARTDYTFFLNMTDKTREVLEFTWDSRGSSPSLLSFSSHDAGYSTIPDNDSLFTEKGHVYTGGYPSFIIAEVGCRLKGTISDQEKPDHYELSADLRCTVTTRDALGSQLRIERVDCAHSFHGLSLTYDELVALFGNSANPYVMRIGIDVENGNSIHIFQGDEAEYGTIINTK
mgnify:CR=1 FL=1